MSLKDEFLKMQKKAEKAIKEAETEIVRSYKVTLDDLYDVSGEMFRKYENHDGKLTYEEMTRYKRLEKLHQILAVTIAQMYKETTKEIKSGLERVYDIGFNQVALKIELETGKRLRGIIRQDVLDRALTNDISGLKWTERMGLHRDHVVMKIRETVTQGLHDGATYKQMADRLNEALSGDVVNPMRIVRTEGHRVFSQAQKDRLDEAYKSGTKMTKTWVSSKDERVRSTHAEMEGVTIPYEGDFVMPDGVEGFAPGIIGAPQHDINCRCTWKIDIVDYEDEKEGGQGEGEDGIIHMGHKAEDEQGISIILDGFTPCLEKRITGEIVQTEYSKLKKPITPKEAKAMKKAGWKFDWSLPQKDGFEIFELRLKNDIKKQGLIALKNDKGFTYIALVEAAPTNVGSKGEYKGVGGHLFAIACEQSFKSGNEGYVAFEPKTILIEHYQKTLNAKMLSRDRMYIDTEAAQKLVEKYIKK